MAEKQAPAEVVLKPCGRAFFVYYVAIARLESSVGQKKPSPTLCTLQKYAKALGCRLELRLVPKKKGHAAA